MARKPMVTRTIATTKLSVLCLDIESAEPFNKEITIAQVFSDEKKLMKAVHKIIDTDSVKAVAIVDKEIVETLYGMDEQKFMELSEILPPRNSAKTDSNIECKED